MGVAQDDVEVADRIGRRCARLLPLAGMGLIVTDAVLVGPSAPRWPAIAFWLLAVGIGFGMVLTGGVWPRRVRALIDDETSRAHRLRAVFVGYCAAVACGTGLYVAASLGQLSAPEALQILLVTVVSAPLIAFGVLERVALGNG